MIAKNIVDSDNFLEMPSTAQLLYFHLLVRGDDEGFIDNPRSIMRNVRCTEDDMKILIAKQYIIPFESGIVVIKHWKIHNYIRQDRLKSTEYSEERALLSLNENNTYELTDICLSNDGQLTDKCQARLVENRLDKSSREEDVTTTIYQKVFTLYSDNIHPITPIESDKLAEDIEKYGEQWCVDAIKRAIVRGKRTLGYIEGILKDWNTNGYDDGTEREKPQTKEPVFRDTLPDMTEEEKEQLRREMYGESKE